MNATAAFVRKGGCQRQEGGLQLPALGVWGEAAGFLRGDGLRSPGLLAWRY